jgi:hypothetical protein
LRERRNSRVACQSIAITISEELQPVGPRVLAGSNSTAMGVLTKPPSDAKAAKQNAAGCRYHGRSQGTDSTLENNSAAMTETCETIDSVAGLRSFVHSTLCARENLLADQFKMRETPLVVCGASCGLQFLIKGPRSVRLSAVWATDTNVIYFYDARGERFLKVRVAGSIDLSAAA